MDVEEKFIAVSALLGEPTRARMLWNLLDGRAYTAGELSIVANTSPTSASNHLSKLLEAQIIKVDFQGRHRYYSLANSEIAYAIEGLANLVDRHNRKKESNMSGIKYCRTCYDHLAGHLAVQIVESLETKGYLQKSSNNYVVSNEGWEWFEHLGICRQQFLNKRRPITRKCLDWSERRSHLAGSLGADLLDKTLQLNWFRKVQFSRELIVTPTGRKELQTLLGVTLP